jgi:hypothetical protein
VDGQGHFVGSPLYWISEDIRISGAVLVVPFHWWQIRKDTHVVTPLTFAPNSGSIKPRFRKRMSRLADPDARVGSPGTYGLAGLLGL